MTTADIRTALLNDIERWVVPSMFRKDPQYLHAIIIDNEDYMLDVAKQMALLAHFPTFDENNPSTRTRISILGKKEPDNWRNKFGRLFDSRDNKDLDGWIDVPLDVQVEYVVENIDKVSDIIFWEKEANKDSAYYQVRFDKGSISHALHYHSSRKIPGMELREQLAMRTHSVYLASQTFDIIRANDVNNVHEFDTPINDFLNISDAEVTSHWKDINDVLKESNRCLADSLCVRWYILNTMKNGNSILETLKNHLLEMSQSEHARWNVEKLISGFRPYTYKEVIEDENLYGTKRDERIKSLKENDSNRAHISLCSYSRLRRINLESIKYDSFLLLAMMNYWEKHITHSENEKH